MSERSTDPVFRNSRREALIIAAAWLAATLSSCLISYAYGYSRDGRPLSAADLTFLFGMPVWFVYGVLGPWAGCAVFTLGYAGFFMAEDDLGADHAVELDRDIREGDGPDELA